MAVMAVNLSRIPDQRNPAMLYELAGLLYESCSYIRNTVPCMTFQLHLTVFIVLVIIHEVVFFSHRFFETHTASQFVVE